MDNRGHWFTPTNPSHPLPVQYFLLFLKISRGSQVMAVLAVEARMEGGKRSL